MSDELHKHCISMSQFSESSDIPALDSLLGDNEDSAAFRIDCHVHTSERSACAWHDADKMVERAAKIGLSATVSGRTQLSCSQTT